MESAKKYILENNKGKNIKVNIKVDKNWKPEAGSPSDNANKDYNFSLKISGVRL